MKNLLLAFLLLLLSFTAFSQIKQFNDTSYHFSLEYPNNWIETNEKDTNLRVVLISEDEKYTLTAYGFYLIDSDIDLEIFAAMDTAFFSRLGAATETDLNRFIPGIFGNILKYALGEEIPIVSIRKKYDKNPNGYYAYAHYEVFLHYAYALITYSKQADFEDIEPIFKSLDISVPLWKRLKDAFSWDTTKRTGGKFIEYLLAFLLGLPFILWLAGIMYCGKHFKLGRKKRIELKKYQNELEEGYVVNDKWKKELKKANFKILWTTSGFIFSFVLVISILFLLGITHYIILLFCCSLILLVFFSGYWGWNLFD